MKQTVNWRKQEYVPMAPKEEPLRQLNSLAEIPRSTLYQVFWNGSELPVFHTEFFDYVLPVVKGKEDLNFEIRILEEFHKTVIRPQKQNWNYQTTAEGITLKLKEPQKAVIEIDDDLLRPLYLLCQSFVEKPENTTYYFEKGHVYNVGTLRLKSNDVVYLEEGSMVCGKIYSRMADNIRICGNGILYGSVWHNWDENCGDQMILTVLGKEITIEGITVVDGGSWHIVPVACQNVQIRNVNILSKVITGDGIDITGCENVEITHCFIRANDDCISIKGAANFDPSGCCDTRNVIVTKCIFWNAEFGNTLEIGYETRCEEICDVIFRDCDVLHCEYEGNQSGGVLTIHDADRAWVHHITYEDIRIEDAQEKFIDIKIVDSKYSTDRRRGMVSDVTFRNVEVTGGAFPVSIIRGFEMQDELKRPDNISFENVTILGEKMESANQLRMVVELTDNLYFK